MKQSFLNCLLYINKLKAKKKFLLIKHCFDFLGRI